jgi:DNA ligase (NAD+)
MIEYLDKASKAYYDGTPFLSDEEFDKLAEMYGYNKVGAPAANAVPHYYRMYSLQKVHQGEVEPTFQEPVKTPKLDGAAISILYINGSLAKILTRGNGEKGQDITDKIRHLVPNSISNTSVLQVNAEVVAPSTIPNARNYAAGALNLKDLMEVKSRDITVVAYEILGINTVTYTENLKQLKLFGFNTVADSLEQFPTDGIVVRENQYSVFNAAGHTSKHPRAAYALKPKPEAQITKLLAVEWQVGRTGVVSPVAILEPVTIGEAVISRATLHNMGYINALGLELNCMVEVIRSGEIIPRIVRKV